MSDEAKAVEAQHPPKYDAERLKMSNNADEVKEWMRSLHGADLIYYSRGKSAFDSPIKRSKVVAQIAKEQLELRDKGGRVVRGCLKAWGKVYTATSGWWVTPMISPERQVGFVDTVRGMAVLAEGVFLEEDVIESLTIPDQSDGVKASGAAAWTSPDAGEGRNAKAPPGWVQLLCDVRTTNDWKADEIQTKQKLVGYGLVNCYKEIGLPSKELDEGYPEPDPSWWHFGEPQKEKVASLVSEWMKGLCLRLARTLPVPGPVVDAIDAGMRHDALYNLTSIYPDQSERTIGGEKSQEQYEQEALIWFRANAAREVVNAVTNKFWISKVFFWNECGERYNSGQLATLRGILMRSVYYKLISVAESVRWMLNMEGVKEKGTCYGVGPHLKQFTEILRAAANEIANVLCFGMDDEANEIVRKKMTAILYENGPIYPDN